MAAVAVLSATSSLLVSLAYLLVARYVEVAAFGESVARLSAATVCAGLVDLGTSSWLLRSGLQGQVGDAVFWRVLRTKMIQTLLVGFLLTLALIVLGQPRSAAICVGLIVPLQVFESLAFARLRWMSSAIHATTANVVDKTCLFLVATVLSLQRANLDILSLAFLIGTACGIGFALLSSRRDPNRLEPSHLPARSGYRWYVAATSLQNIDSILIAALGGSVAAGLYGSVSRWMQAIGIVSAAYTQSEVSEFAQARSDSLATSRLTRGAVLLIPAGVLVVAVWLAAPVLVTSLLGERYSDATLILRVLLLAAIPAMINQPLVALFQVRHRDRLAAKIVGGCIALQLLGIAVAAPRYGALGAAAAAVTAQCVLATLLIRFWRSVLRASELRVQ